LLLLLVVVVVLVLFKVKSDLKHIFEQLINWDVDIVIGLILLSTTTAPTTTHDNIKEMSIMFFKICFVVVLVLL